MKKVTIIVITGIVLCLVALGLAIAYTPRTTTAATTYTTTQTTLTTVEPTATTAAD